MKLYILFVGLISLVPVDDQNLFVLLPDASEATQRVVGDKTLVAGAHEAQIGYLDSEGQWEVEPLRGDLSFFSPGTQNRDLSSVLEMNQILGNAGEGVVNPDCVKWGAEAGDCPAIARIRLSGGRIVTGHGRLDTKIEGPPKERWNGLAFMTEFRGVFYSPGEFDASGVTPNFDYVRQGATALLFEMEVPGDFSLELPSGPVSLSKTPATCGSLVQGAEGPCFFLRIGNIPNQYFVEGDQPPVGHEDLHFLHFYSLLRSEPGATRLPIVVNVMEEADTGGKPSVECPYVRMESGR